MSHWIEGHLLAERYELQHRLGCGSAGECWLALDRVLGARVALKVFDPDLLTSPAATHWLAEVLPRIRALAHPRLVRFSEPIHLEGRLALSMDYFAGDDFTRFRGRSVGDILSALSPALDALVVAHREGLAHGGVKASNVLCDATGATFLADLGIAALAYGAGVDLARLDTGAFSPDRLAGQPPRLADDVYAVGVLLFEWISGRHPFRTERATGVESGLHMLPPLTPRASGGEPVPEALETLVSQMLAHEASKRPDMEEVQGVLASLGGSGRLPSSPTLEAPPAGDTLDAAGLDATEDWEGDIEAVPLAPVVHPERAPAARSGRDSMLRNISVGAFAALLVAAVGVFYFLPRAVERRIERERAAGELTLEATGDVEAAASGAEAPRSSRRAKTLESLPHVGVAPADLVREARERIAAEQALEAAIEKRDVVAARDVDLWAADDFAGANLLVETGMGNLRHSEYDDARAAFESALERFENLEGRADTLLQESLRAGELALAAGEDEEAIERFELALSLDPENARALHGLERAESADEVFAALRTGARLEAEGELAEALAAYDRALELDPEVESARVARVRVRDLLAEIDYLAAMMEAYAALDRGEFNRATGAFERARLLRPQAPGPREGITQAQRGLRLREIGSIHARAEELEREERWGEAAEQYEAVLGLDPALLFALRGRSRTRQMEAMSNELQRFADHPERLSSPEVFDQAVLALERANTLTDPGPEFSRQIAAAKLAVERAGTPITIHLKSDLQTDVVVYRVGKLGNFESRRLELRPGTYTVVGTREGYRDVRKRITLRAGEAPEPVVVRCEEKI